MSSVFSLSTVVGILLVQAIDIVPVIASTHHVVQTPFGSATMNAYIPVVTPFHEDQLMNRRADKADWICGYDTHGAHEPFGCGMNEICANTTYTSMGLVSHFFSCCNGKPNNLNYVERCTSLGTTLFGPCKDVTAASLTYTVQGTVSPYNTSPCKDYGPSAQCVVYSFQGLRGEGYSGYSCTKSHGRTWTLNQRSNMPQVTHTYSSGDSLSTYRVGDTTAPLSITTVGIGPDQTPSKNPQHNDSCARQLSFPFWWSCASLVLLFQFWL